MSFVVERTIGNHTLRIENGRLAMQADGAVVVSYGETVVLVTACMSPNPRPGTDFVPLTVDYEERLYAAGKIPGGFIRREGRPSQDATLAMRLTDRCLRPLLPKHLRNDLQVVVTVLSADQENDPDVLSIIGASAALAISNIPFGGPVGAVRVGLRDGRCLINPTFTDLATSRLDLVVAATESGLVMVEAGASGIDEASTVEAIEFGTRVIADIIALQRELVAMCGKPKIELAPVQSDGALREAVASAIGGRFEQMRSAKSEREDVLNALRAEVVATMQDGHSEAEVVAVFEDLLKAEVRRGILQEGCRPDGRGVDEIRPLKCEVGLLPRTHGSGLFTRGLTQVLTITTLGSPGEEQRLDTLAPEEKRRFLHHYNFPPFSVGEVRRLGGPSRRDIGHGALAERAILPVIPPAHDFPYTIRLVSEVLSSNGSTSMASVCGSTLSLMDAGVPILAPVAGVAMGLVGSIVLTDIEGMEDALGDMDFKVAGTAQGITALQMDIKVTSLPFAVISEALERAREARLFILDRMLQTIAESRAELSPYAPRMVKIQINPDKIRNVIGPGGKIIRSLTDEYKVSIDVEDDGTIFVGSHSEDAAQKAIAAIRELTREVEVGQIYNGRVTRLVDFGAFVEVLPGKDGLVRLGELADSRPSNVEDVVKIGDEIMVMVIEIDRQGRVNLSRRAVLEGLTPAEALASAERPPAPRSRPGGRPFDSGRDGGGPPRGGGGPRRPMGGGGPPPPFAPNR